MKAWIIEAFGGRDKLKLADLPKPEPAEGEVLVRIQGVGVNPVDWKIREGRLKDLMSHKFPVVPGWDMAGVVEEVGFSARRFAPGDDVYAYARRPVVQKGTYAEYIALPESYLSKKPETLSVEAAASIPLVSLTATQSLFDAGGLATGETAFIIGASGGVGSSAVQFAKLAGARVIAMASKSNHDYLKSLGADEIIDYAAGDFRDTLKKIVPEGADLVYDCFGGDALAMAVDCVKTGGRLVSITGEADEERLKAKEATFHFVFVEPNAKQLDHFRELIDNKRFKANVSQVFPFESAVEAHEQMETGHTRGKIVLKL